MEYYNFENLMSDFGGLMASFKAAVGSIGFVFLIQYYG